MKNKLKIRGFSTDIAYNSKLLKHFSDYLNAIYNIFKIIIIFFDLLIIKTVIRGILT